jgi:hypothetical protein
MDFISSIMSVVPIVELLTPTRQSKLPRSDSRTHAPEDTAAVHTVQTGAAPSNNGDHDSERVAKPRPGPLVMEAQSSPM